MRIRLIALVLAVCVSTVTLSAQFPYIKTAAEVTVAGSAIALFASADVSPGSGHPAATVANCSLSGANIRVSYSGTDPTTSLGQILTPGLYTVTGTAVMLNLKGIRDDSTSATWNCVVQGQ